MEIIRGKHVSFIDSLAHDDGVHLDIGTGDGRFVRHVAQNQPHSLVIGLDACRENLHEVSRRAPANAIFVIANAQTLPPELDSTATQITINFPWGSLLEGLVENDAALLDGLVRVARQDAKIELRLNGGALAEAGWSLDEGTRQIQHNLSAVGFDMRPGIALTTHDLKACPTTWAKRLAFGRDPRANYLRGKL